MFDQPRQMKDFPIYEQIQKNEGPRIQELNCSIRNRLTLVLKKKDVDAAKKLVDCSRELADIYYTVLVKDLQFTFGCNLEKYLWNQGFYKIIDCLKTVTASAHPNANVNQLRNIFLNFLTQAITYYRSLISLYEETYAFSLADLLQMWTNGLPTDDFKSVISRSPTVTSKRNQLVSMSCSRLLVSLGDLYRYQAQANGSKDYSLSRSSYLKSVYLWPSSGHGYNQLAVLALFSERVVDEVFYIVRSISVQYPFESAKERLHSRFGAMRKKVAKYEQLLNNEIGEVSGYDEIAEWSDRPQELWVAVDGVAEPDKSVFRMYLQQPPNQLHRRVVSYLVDLAGMLSVKIGMDQFKSVSERAISQLAALVTMADSPMTGHQLIQISVIFMHAVHSSSKKDVDTISLQQQLALQTVVSLFGALLHPITDEIDDMKIWMSNEECVPIQVLRVLPALYVLSHWLMSPTVTELFRSAPSIEPLPISTMELDTWAKLAALATNLQKCADLAQLLEPDSFTNQFVMPECVFISSFLDVFPATSPTIYCDQPELCPAGIRLSKLLKLCQHFHFNKVPCCSRDEDTGIYRKFAVSLSCNKELDQTQLGSRDFNLNPIDVSRDALLSKEQKKSQRILLVYPTIVVPDTNVFVDHLDMVKKVVDSNRFQVFICTIVIDELNGLALARPEDSDTPHDLMVTSNAKMAVAWLKERAKEKNNRMGTLTTTGQKMAMKIVTENVADSAGGMVNDDRILRSCILYTDRNPLLDLPSSIKPPTSDVAPIMRNLVLLSEDRGICIKASTQNIPSRTIQNFIRWAKIV